MNHDQKFNLEIFADDVELYIMISFLVTFLFLVLQLIIPNDLGSIVLKVISLCFVILICVRIGLSIVLFLNYDDALMKAPLKNKLTYGIKLLSSKILKALSGVVGAVIMLFLGFKFGQYYYSSHPEVSLNTLALSTVGFGIIGGRYSVKITQRLLSYEQTKSHQV